MGLTAPGGAVSLWVIVRTTDGNERAGKNRSPPTRRGEVRATQSNPQTEGSLKGNPFADARLSRRDKS